MTTAIASSPVRHVSTAGQPAADQRTLRHGARGEDVRAVQQQLVDRGARIAVDGVYGDDTARAVRAFQRTQTGLTVDGVVGPATRGRLASSPTVEPRAGTPVRREGDARAPSVAERGATPPEGTVRAGDLARTDEARRRGEVTLAPANATPEEKFRHYADIVRRNGGQVNPNGQATVLGLRGLSRGRDGAHDTGSTRAYDDTFVVLQNGRAYELRGATHPGQLRSSLSPDVNRDGVGDVGMIAPGNYTATPNGPHNGAPSWHVKRPSGNDRIPGYRDTNGDGRFSEAERAASERRNDTLGDILFHQGFGDRPKSIGCLTMSPATFQDFMRHVGGSGRAFNFTLVDAAR